LSKGDGTVVFESESLRALPISLPPRSTETSHAAFHDVLLPGLGSFRFMSGNVRRKGEPWVCHVGVSLEGYRHELAQLKLILLMILPVGLLAALAGGYLLAGRALAPVHLITSTARSISAKNLAERVVVANRDDELGRLADTFNGMITRLEHSFDAMRQFTADASHELLTPLTAMRTEVEVSLRAERSSEQYRRVLASVLEEVERLTKLADDLLLLSREDAKAIGPEFERLRLDLLVQEVAGHVRALAEESGISMAVSNMPPATVFGDADALRQVFFNLLDNAVKYTPQGGSVTICGLLNAGEVGVEISDTGIGIPLDSVPRVFDRFYRVDKSRSRELGGTGLGLSIAKALVERHRGRIEVESTVGKGSTFRVYLPMMGDDQVDIQQEAKP
jgi:heavy metal sensor kinase